jgi:hypothetical protein
MPSDPLLLFDPRRTIQLQGFSGRAATTTLHDATETGFQISGIFQAAEDFANVQLFSAYDYFNHLRLKPLPVTDLSVLKSRMVDAPAPDYGEQPSLLATEQFTTTNTSCELKLRLAGPLSQFGRDANGMPVRVSVDGENKIVRIEKKDDEFGATSFATAVESAANDRVYRFTFPLATLSGYRNGDRTSLVPVPANDIVKIHLTFAPRFEDVEYGLAARRPSACTWRAFMAHPTRRCARRMVCGATVACTRLQMRSRRSRSKQLPRCRSTLATRPSASSPRAWASPTNTASSRSTTSWSSTPARRPRNSRAASAAHSAPSRRSTPPA